MRKIHERWINHVFSPLIILQLQKSSTQYAKKAIDTDNARQYGSSKKTESIYSYALYDLASYMAAVARVHERLPNPDPVN